MKRIAILMTAFFLMFAVTTPAFADDTGKKSCETATIAVNFEAVYLLDDLAPLADVPITTDVSQYVSQEDYPADIVHAAVFTSKHNQESFNIYKKSPKQATIATAGTVAVNYDVNIQANTEDQDIPLIQSQAITNKQASKSKDATATTRPEGCECDIVVTIEISSEEVILTDTPDKQMPDVVPRK